MADFFFHFSEQHQQQFGDGKSAPTYRNVGSDDGHWVEAVAGSLAVYVYAQVPTSTSTAMGSVEIMTNDDRRGRTKLKFGKRDHEQIQHNIGVALDLKFAVLAVPRARLTIC